MTPHIKTLLATVIFSLFGIISFVMYSGETSSVLPLFIFYVLLIINTYFSVRLFFTIIPSTLKSQIVVDTVLAVFYFLLAFTFANAFYFTLFLTLFFAISTVKYSMLRKTVANQPRLLRRKITVNALGSILGLFTFVSVTLGYTPISLWLLVVIFALANIYLFFISPLYVLDSTI